MTTSRKIFVFGRHGEAPQKQGGGSIDALVPQAVKDMYERVGVPLQSDIAEAGISVENAFLVHSPRIRTQYTGQAILAGAFGFMPNEGTNPPSCQEDLSHYDFSGIEDRVDARLDFGKPYINMTVYSQYGTGPCVDYWLAHPEDAMHGSEAIEPYATIHPRTRDALLDAVQRLVTDEKDLGILITHAGLVEAIAITLVNAGRKTNVERCDDIGGAFGMGNVAKMVIERTGSGLYTAILQRNDQNYAVDLSNLL